MKPACGRQSSDDQFELFEMRELCQMVPVRHSRTKRIELMHSKRIQRSIIAAYKQSRVELERKGWKNRFFRRSGGNLWLQTVHITTIQFRFGHSSISFEIWFSEFFRMDCFEIQTNSNELKRNQIKQKQFPVTNDIDRVKGIFSKRIKPLNKRRRLSRRLFSMKMCFERSPSWSSINRQTKEAGLRTAKVSQSSKLRDSGR